jgi:hypothetical protein
MEPRCETDYRSWQLLIQVHKAHYEKKTKEAKKASQVAEKERRRRERETVQVGPLYNDTTLETV